MTNAFDIFFKKFAYKFPKGYPDMKNEQDITLLDSLINEVLEEDYKLLLEAGEKFERQENAFIDAVKNSLKSSEESYIILNIGGTTIDKVTGAKKRVEKTSKGKEPITDVIISTQDGDINLSMKGTSSPSLAGGGFTGLKNIAPNFVNDFILKTYKELINKDLKTGDNFPDVYTEIPDDITTSIVKGDKESGGPIDYIYVGNMNVDYKFEDNTLTINNAELYTPEQLGSKKLYLRLRKRREDQRFDATPPENGLPKITTKSPSKGDSNYRLVVTNSVPNNAVIV